MFMIYEAVDDHLVELPNYKHLTGRDGLPKTLFVHKAGTFSIVAGYVHYHFVDVSYRRDVSFHWYASFRETN